MAYFRSHVLVSIDPQWVKRDAYDLMDTLQDELVKQGLVDEVQVLETSRIGDPETEGPDLMVYPEAVHYTNLSVEDMPFLVEEHFLKGRVTQQYAREMKALADEELSAPKAKEVRVVLKNIDEIDPLNIEEYIAKDGYLALGKVLTEMTPEEVIQEVLDSGLRGRGGTGFPIGFKWNFIPNAVGEPKYIICNADEGDPHSVIEGMIIGAYAAGSSQGYINCRAEHPIAVQTMKTAINQARSFGLFGEIIMCTDFSFDLEIRMYAGALVCGEETALITSNEGARGKPKLLTQICASNAASVSSFALMMLSRSNKTATITTAIEEERYVRRN
jgi:(2Fe-2S) ferredoxin